MKLRILGCSGGIGGELRTTSMLLDEDVLVDAGTGAGDLSIAELAQIDHVFVTHSHMDHVASIPFIVDTVGWMREKPLTVHATAETLQILRDHLFNWKLWPDFSQIPDAQNPMLRFEKIEVGVPVTLDGRAITALPANHVVPAVGYQVDSGAASLVFTGDTTTNDALWPYVNRVGNLRYLIIETALSDRERELAVASKHLCPSLLAEELAKLTGAPDIYITHLKPRETDLIMEEIAARVPERRPQMLNATTYSSCEGPVMISVLPGGPVGEAVLADKLTFQQQLQAVTNKVHASSNLDEIMVEISQELCELFQADRLTLYVVSEDKMSIVSKVKTGLASFKDIKLPINEQSVAGWVALHKRVVNIRDVYDDAELKSYGPQLHFLKAVDTKTGYRTRQMLVAPILEARNKELVGVVQIINSRSGKPFPPMMEEGVAQLAETLAIALQQRQKPTMMPLRSKYEALVANAVLSSDELELAQRSARRKNLDLETVLVEEFQVKTPDLGNALSVYFAVPYEPFKADRVRPGDLLRNMSREFCETNQWVPLGEDQDGLLVMALDPEQTRSARMVVNVYPKSKIVYTVTTNKEFQQTLEQQFGMGMMDDNLGDIGDLLGSLDEEEGEGAAEDIASAASDNELVKLVNKVIIDAYKQGASDIHIEPYPGKAKTEVRFRRDGALMPYISVPASYRSALAARIKIMCDLDISERRKPQDGKIKFKKFGPLDIELRVATIPTQGGVEDIVMRILAGGEPIPMDKLGLSSRNLALAKSTVEKPYGLFFVCGPTGSGKTTTLHSVLGYLNQPDTKIWTAEDPVEITQKGLRQVQVNRKAGLDFAMVMKAFLRADPDIIMVGEMRDKETVSTGIEASLTGHLVFATLHTNSAPESIVRLLDMGMDPFNFSDALLGILAQRLARRLCKCKEGHVATDQEIDLLLDEYAQELLYLPAWKADPKTEKQKLREEWVKDFGNESGEITLYTAKGCDVCSGTGYKGRMGLHELLIGTDRIKQQIQEHARVAQMLVTGLEDGMRTLKQDGIEKVMQGFTDMAQVRAVCIK